MVKIAVIAFQLLLVLHQDHGGKNSFSQQCGSAEVSDFMSLQREGSQ